MKHDKLINYPPVIHETRQVVYQENLDICDHSSPH